MKIKNSELEEYLELGNSDVALIFKSDGTTVLLAPEREDEEYIEEPEYRALVILHAMSSDTLWQDMCDNADLLMDDHIEEKVEPKDLN